MWSIVGAQLTLIICAALTIVLSLGMSLGIHPEAIFGAEWITPIFGLIIAGAIMRRFGLWVSVGTGLIIGLIWALFWLYLMGRLDFHLWITEALPYLSWQHLIAWISAPILAFTGYLLAGWFTKRSIGWVFLALSGPVVILMTALITSGFIDAPGKYNLAKGADLTISAPDREGTILRLFTFDFAANPNLSIGTYDCDSDDSHPNDDINSTYLGTPAISVFRKLKQSPLCIINAAFFTWTEPDRIGSHVAPIVSNHVPRYNVFNGPDIWTFGCKTNKTNPHFTLEQGVPYGDLARKYHTAIGHVRPLIVDGKPLVLKPGPGVTRLRCSRISLGWSSDSKLHILVVREPDGEMASIKQWKLKGKQTGGMDLPQLQQYWMKMGVKQALILDAGDFTDLLYQTESATRAITSARISKTLCYLQDKPIRVWIPILPTTTNTIGVMNYLYINS